MTKADPVAAVTPLRVPGGPGERRRRDPGAADAFRRALQQDGGAADPEVPTKPSAPSGLQPRRSYDRRDPDAPACHVDVVA